VAFFAMLVDVLDLTDSVCAGHAGCGAFFLGLVFVIGNAGLEYIGPVWMFSPARYLSELQSI